VFNLAHELLLTLVMLVLGVGFRTMRVLPDNASEVINKLVLNLCLPALILSVVSQLTFSRALLWVPLIAWLVMGSSALVIKLIARAGNWPRDVEGALLLTGVLGNTAFLGYPLTRAYLGDASLGTAVLYDQLGSFLVFSSFGLWVAASYGGGKAPSVAETLKRIITFPAFLALCGALLLSFLDIPLPGQIKLLADDVKVLLVPLAMLAVGLNFSLVPPSKQSLPLVFGLSVKMLLAPLLALGLAQVLLDRQALQVVGLEAAMPPMVTAAALAANAKLAPQLAAAMAGFGILIAIFWLPLLHRWLG
jgi:malate permease and related proteins